MSETPDRRPSEASRATAGHVPAPAVAGQGRDTFPGPPESRDGVVALLFALMLVLLAAGLTGAHWVFAYGMVAWLGTLVALGFVRQGEPRTWAAAAVAFLGFAIGMTGLLWNEAVVVRSPADTVLGFHPGTAFLVYGIWLPGFFTLAVSFALLFDRLVYGGRAK